MAAGDIAISRVESVGNSRVAVGTLEADWTTRAFAVGGTGISLLDLLLTPTAGQASANVTLNVNADGTATKGTAAIRSNTTEAAVFMFRATFV